MSQSTVRSMPRKNLSDQEIRDIARALGPQPADFKWHTELLKLAQRQTQPHLRDTDLRTVDFRPFWTRETWHVAALDTKASRPAQGLSAALGRTRALMGDTRPLEGAEHAGNPYLARTGSPNTGGRPAHRRER